MKFKKWLSLDEARYKGLQRQWDASNPDAPRYVRQQLYNALVSPAFKRALAAPQYRSPPPSPQDTHVDATAPTILVGANSPPNSPGEVRYNGPRPNSVSKVMDDNDFIQNVRFSKKAQAVTIGPLSLDSGTRSRLETVRWGLNPRNDLVRNDAARHALHQTLASSRGEGANEPIVLVRMGENSYDILDGHHRTASYMIRGAPREDIEAIKAGDFSRVDYSKWRSVTLRAFVGFPKSSQHMSLPVSSPPMSSPPLADPEPTMLNHIPRPAAA